MSNEVVAELDFETRSACSLRKCGSWRYSLDPSTEILCMVWRLPHWPEGETALWHPAFPHLGIDEGDDWEQLYELLDWIDEGGLVEAHNAWFERGIWTNILVPRYHFPPVPHGQWRCSAAKAATHALPRALEQAVEALGLDIEKDLSGSKTMKKMAAPRKARKAEYAQWCNAHGAGRCVTCKGKGVVRKVPCNACKGRGSYPGNVGAVPPMPVLWHESRELLERLWDYCRVDVLAEQGLSESIPDLTDLEIQMYLMDQAVNERGFMLDRQAIDIAMALIDEESVKLTAELVALTGGRVERATQRERMISWLADEGLELDNTQAATLDEVLKDTRSLAPCVARGLTIMRALGRSSTAKYVAMRNWICPDDRVHGGLLYHGAATGRWSGSGIQPHNFPKGTIKKDTAGNKWSMDDAWDDIHTGDSDELEATYGEGAIMAVLSQALRGAIVAAPGKHLFVADYAAIEARVLLWLAGDEHHLDIFRRGEDIYCEMASSIYGRTITPDEENQPPERALGKVAVLGLGYQMGAPKFEATCDKFGIPIEEELSVRTVDAYRKKFWLVKQMWWDQEAAACEAVRRPAGSRVQCGKVVWVREGDFLYCILPSGRRLAYPFPKLKLIQTPWGATKDQLTFKGINPVTRQWHTQTTYGGMLVENITQAVARDVLAEAMLRCEQSGVYTPILSVHDEIIAEADPERANVKAFLALMTTLPEWADGMPIEATGWSGGRYRK